MNFNIIEIAGAGVAEVNRHSVQQRERRSTRREQERTGGMSQFTLVKKKTGKENANGALICKSFANIKKKGDANECSGRTLSNIQIIECD